MGLLVSERVEPGIGVFTPPRCSVAVPDQVERGHRGGYETGLGWKSSVKIAGSSTPGLGSKMYHSGPNT